MPLLLIASAEFSVRVSYADYADMHTNSSGDEKKIIRVADEVAPIQIIHVFIFRLYDLQ